MYIKLPIQYPCIIDCFSGVAGNVCIYMNYPKAYTPLLIANHFLVSYSNKLGHGGYNWKFYNDDYGYFIDCKEEAKKNGVINTIMKYVSKGKYIKLIIDFYYISKSPWYKEEPHMLHWIPMIFGFDDKKEIVYLCDNLQNGKFQIIEVPFFEIEAARLGYEDNIFEYCYYDKEINYNLTLDHLKVLIHSYLDSKCYISKSYHSYSDMVENHNQIDNEEVCGVILYEIILRQVEECYNDPQKYDIKTIHIMVEHMRICNTLIEWLNGMNYIQCSDYSKLNYIGKWYNILLNRINLVENLYIKMSIVRKVEILKKIKQELKRMKMIEVKILNDLFVILN